MNHPSGQDSPLHAYDADPEACDRERLRRIMELKAAIQSGNYRTDERLAELLGRMQNRLEPDSNTDDSVDDA